MHFKQQNNKIPEELNEVEISNLPRVQGIDQQMYEKNERK